MLFKTHLLLGILLFLLLFSYFPPGNVLIMFMLVLLGSIFPDIDERRSRINRWSGILGSLVAFFVKHRGIFHSLVLALPASLLLGMYWENSYGLAFLLGYLAHLMGDSFTRMGIQALYPFSTYKVRGPIKVGGWLEGLLFMALAILILRMVI